MAANLSLLVEVDRQEPDEQFLRVYWDGQIASNGDRIPGPQAFTQFPQLGTIQIWTNVFRRAGDGLGEDGFGGDGLEQATFDLQEGDGLGEDGIGQDGLVGQPIKTIKLPGIFRDGLYTFKVVQVNQHGTESSGVEQQIQVIGTQVRPPTRLRLAAVFEGYIRIIWEPSPDIF